jgi:hypothetical protein
LHAGNQEFDPWEIPKYRTTAQTRKINTFGVIIFINE